MTAYPAEGMVTFVPLSPPGAALPQMSTEARERMLRNIETGIGYQLVQRRNEPGHSGVWAPLNGDSSEAREFARILALDAGISRDMERLVAYCPNGCALVTVYSTGGGLLIYVAGTSIITGAGATLRRVRCRHLGYPFPQVDRVLAETPRTARRCTVGMSRITDT